jgi:polysaccharide biosynthesis protein PslE
MTSRNIAETPFGELFQSLCRHKRIAVSFFCLSVAGAMLLTLAIPKEYRSVGKLFVRLGRENATLDPTATLGQNQIVAVPQSRDNEINSVVEILQSRTLLEKVVDGLGPDVVLNARNPDAAEASQETGSWLGQFVSGGKDLLSQFGSNAGLDDRQRALLLLAKKLNVDSPKKSSVIQISYDGSTPEQCQSVVAKLIDSYLDEHLRLNRTSGSHQFFIEQTKRLRDELSRREAELRDAKNETGLASPDAQRQLLVARIGRLEDDLLTAETARAVAQAKVKDLRNQLSRLPESEVAAETSGFGNEGTDRMRDQFYALQVREKEAAAKYTDEHPKMRQIHEQIAAARAVLEKEDLNRKQVTKQPGKLHQQAEAAILAEEPALASLLANTERLKTQLAGARKNLAALNDNELRVAALQREVNLIDADYRKYAGNLEESHIDQQLEMQRMSNIGIVQPASFEPRPIRPNKLLNLLLGIGFGAFGGLALPLALDRFGGKSPTAPVTSRTRPEVFARLPRLSNGHLTGSQRRAPR